MYQGYVKMGIILATSGKLGPPEALVVYYHTA